MVFQGNLNKDYNIPGRGKKMKMKVMMMLMMIMMAMGLMAEEVKIKESKLTSLRYVKKICQITDTYKGEDYTAYELDGGKGRFVTFKGGTKICLIFKNGELYGRYATLADKDIGVTFNLHDKRCYQRTTTETQGSWIYTYYYNDESLESQAEQLRGKMQNWANVWGLNK